MPAPTLWSWDRYWTTVRSSSTERDGFLVIEGFVGKQACDELKAAANRIVAEFEPSTERTIFTTTEQQRVSNGEFLASGSGIWCFFEEEAFDHDGQLRTSKAVEHQQDRARDARSRSDLRAVLVPSRACRRRRRHRPHRCAGIAEHVHLQAAPHRRRGRVPPGQHLLVHRTDDGHRVLVRHRRRHLAERVSVGQARRASHQPPQAVQAGGRQRRRRHRLRGARSRATTVAVRTRAARGSGGHVGRAARSASPLERHQPVSEASRHAYSLHCISASAEYPEWNWLRRPPEMPLRSLAGVAA